MHTVAVIAASRSVGGTTLAAWLGACAHGDTGAPVVALDAGEAHGFLAWARAEQPPGLIAAAWDASCNADTVRALADEGVGLVLIDATLTAGDPRRFAILDACDLAVIVVQPDGSGLDGVGAVLDCVEDAMVPFVFVVNQATDDEEMTAATVVSLAQHGTVSPVIQPRYAACAPPSGDDTETPDPALAEDMARQWDYLRGRLGPPQGADASAEMAADPEPDAALYDRPATFVVPEMVYPCHVIDITADGLVFTSEKRIEPGVRLRMNLPYVGQIDCEIAEAAQGRMNAQFVIDDARRAELMTQVATLVDYGRERGAVHAA